jgi:xylulokinase
MAVSVDAVIGLDVGTSGSRAVAVGADGTVLAVSDAAHPSQLTGPGRIEQDPADWWASVVTCLREITRVTGPVPQAVGLSGQMDGPVLIGAAGRVLGRCHIWADSRATAEAQQITARAGAEQLIAVTGKPAVPAYTAPKLLWIKVHEPDRFAAVERILLPKDYLRWRLTGVVATDPSDASNTLLFDVTRRRWSAELAAELGIPADLLPAVAESADVTGGVTAAAAATTGLAAGVPVVAGAGDSITAAVASGLVPGGPVLTVLGSSGNVSAVFGRPLIDRAGRVHTGCHATPATWIGTGVQQVAGLALQWVRDLLPGGRGTSYDELTALAARAGPGSGGLTFLPYLAGTRSPEYNPAARGAFAGLSIGHTAGHLVRAVMEGVVFTQRDSVLVFAELGIPVPALVTVGGGARSAVWRAIQAGVHGVPVANHAPAHHLEGGEAADGSALGAAIIAGTAAGMFGSLADGADQVRAAAGAEAVSQTPDPADVSAYQNAYARYRRVARQLAIL